MLFGDITIENGIVASTTRTNPWLPEILIIDNGQTKHDCLYKSFDFNLRKFLNMLKGPLFRKIPCRQQYLIIVYHHSLNRTKCSISSHFSEKLLNDCCILLIMLHRLFIITFGYYRDVDCL